MQVDYVKGLFWGAFVALGLAIFWYPGTDRIPVPPAPVHVEQPVPAPVPAPVPKPEPPVIVPQPQPPAPAVVPSKPKQPKTAPLRERNKSTGCKDVPKAAYQHPQDVVIEAARRMGVSAEKMATLKRCINAT